MQSPDETAPPTLGDEQAEALDLCRIKGATWSAGAVMGGDKVGEGNSIFLPFIAGGVKALW